MPEKTSEYLRHIREELAAINLHALVKERRISATVELAALFLNQFKKYVPRKGRRGQKEFYRIIQDRKTKAFLISFLDQAFRSKNNDRTLDQYLFLLRRIGFPIALDWDIRIFLHLFYSVGRFIPKCITPFFLWPMRVKGNRYVMREEHLEKHCNEYQIGKEELTICHLLGEGLGHEDAEEYCQKYASSAANPQVGAFIVQLSAISNAHHPFSLDHSIEQASEKLRKLLRAAKDKMLILDANSYSCSLFTHHLLMKVLDEEEFIDSSIGVTLSAFIPDTWQWADKLLDWAKNRVLRGGKPITLRLTKGNFLGKEQVDASLNGWALATYANKVETDAHFKKLILKLVSIENLQFAKVRIATHNFFDIAFALIVRAERGIDKNGVTFETTLGIGDHLFFSLRELAIPTVMYCPMVGNKSYKRAISYLSRMFQEYSNPDHFIYRLPDLSSEGESWETQVEFFKEACEMIDTISTEPRRKQDRSVVTPHHPYTPFENEPDTDFAQEANQKWLSSILQKQAIEVKDAPLFSPIPKEGWREKRDISNGEFLYAFTTLDGAQLSLALEEAKKEEPKWQAIPFQEKQKIAFEIAQELRKQRGKLLSFLIASSGRPVKEADREISYAIDLLEYYARAAKDLLQNSNFSFNPKGTIAVLCEENYPLSFATHYLISSLLMGNCALFIPSLQFPYLQYLLANIFWDKGVSKKALHFLPVEEKSIVTLLHDPRLNQAYHYGSSERGIFYASQNVTLPFYSLGNGKNCIIVTKMADRELAIRGITQSAFGQAGQKITTCHLVILEEEIYQDALFKKKLKDAVQSLQLGSCWNPTTQVPPLHTPPNKELFNLYSGEEWLVEPKQIEGNLWQPGVKWDVKINSPLYNMECSGPILGILCAKDLQTAIQIANGTGYGLSAGLFSLDEREHELFKEEIEASNCFINRPMTGVKTFQQPFGGLKKSVIGAPYKMGGPNFLLTAVRLKEEKLPTEVSDVHAYLEGSTAQFSPEEKKIWKASLSSYFYWSKWYKMERDPIKLIGQDNFFLYKPISSLCLRLQENDSSLNILQIVAVSALLSIPLTISFDKPPVSREWLERLPVTLVQESDEIFAESIAKNTFEKIRTIEPLPDSFYAVALATRTQVRTGSPFAYGRFELLHYLKEQTISYNYHRYGYLGMRETELRRPIT